MSHNGWGFPYNVNLELARSSDSYGFASIAIEDEYKANQQFPDTAYYYTDYLWNDPSKRLCFCLYAQIEQKRSETI